MARILLIDDDTSLREVVTFMLSEDGHEVLAAANGQAGLDRLGENPDVVLTDVQMPGMDGMEVLEKILANPPEPTPAIIVMTAHGTVKQAVKAMRMGAFSYLLKPFSRDELLVTISQALHTRNLEQDNIRLRRIIKTRKPESGLIYSSKTMVELMDQVRKVAASEATVLVTGESGTGKELISRACHDLSPRWDKPFVPVNCGAIPEGLMESELFGHTKGSFTGADRDAEGKMRRAHGGTLFLDEVAELPLSLQPKLLRALETHTVEPVGSNKTLDADFRLVCATHRNLQEEVAAGRFREDLYYRLNVMHLNIPSLKNRADDIPLLWDHFSNLHGGAHVSSSTDLIAKLQELPWPGNIRELKNLNQRLVVMRQGDDLGSSDLARLASPGQQTTPTAMSMETMEGDLPLGPLPAEGVSLLEIEKEVIRKALVICNGNRSKTAAFLEIPRHVLIYRLSKYDLDV
jgi:DNA-binding NtrC family response regulator